MKNLLIQAKMLLILVVDLVAAFCALFLMVLFRYGKYGLGAELYAHLLPFLFIISLFVLIFYIFNLYSFRFNKNTTEFTNSFIKSLAISFFLSVLIFYVFGDLFKLTPKTNLVLFTGIFGVIDFYLRILIKRFFVKNKINRKIIVVSKEKNVLVEELIQNQNIGYEIIKQTSIFNLNEIISLNPDAIVIDQNTVIELDEIFKINKSGIFVYTINKFYEEILQKIPTDNIEKSEIIDYLGKNREIFNFTKRVLDIILSISLIIILAPFFILTAIFVKITSRGPVLIRQKRISKNGEIFTLYKFRSMISMSLDGQGEKNGAVWTENNKVDTRITPVGRFIRETHLDEIPQLINILSGDISFVGPRPERPEFMKLLNENILYYNIRHSIKAGLTGWAQVNYKYGSSVEDAREKLKYDFYYIKNRNIFFDFLIALKTVAKVFMH